MAINNQLNMLSSAIIVINVPVTAAQMKDDIAESSDAGGVLLIAAQGANTMIIPLIVVYDYVYNSIPYATGGTVKLSYNKEGAWYASTGIPAADFYATGNSIIQDVCVFQGPYAVSENAVNQALYLSSPDAFTNGNSIVNVHLTYQVIRTAT